MEVSIEGELPVVDMGSCPFPTLTDLSEDRSMCRLEERMISEAVGQPMRLSSCRLDGDSCCQFSAIGIVERDESNAHQCTANPTDWQLKAPQKKQELYYTNLIQP